MNGRTGIGKKGQALLRAAKYMKLWQDMLVKVLKRHKTSKKKEDD